MVTSSAQQAVLSSRNCPEGFQIIVPFFSNDDYADDDIKSVSCTYYVQLASVDSIYRYQTRVE